MKWLIIETYDLIIIIIISYNTMPYRYTFAFHWRRHTHRYNDHHHSDQPRFLDTLHSSGHTPLHEITHILRFSIYAENMLLQERALYLI